MNYEHCSRRIVWIAKKINLHFKKELLKIARQVLEFKGLGGFEIRKIAKAAGCSVGTIYNHYINLDDLIVQTNAVTLDNLKDLMFKDITTEDSAKEIICKICLSYITDAHEHHAEWLFLFEYPVKTPTSILVSRKS